VGLFPDSSLFNPSSKENELKERFRPFFANSVQFDKLELNEVIDGVKRRMLDLESTAKLQHVELQRLRQAVKGFRAYSSARITNLEISLSEQEENKTSEEDKRKISERRLKALSLTRDEVLLELASSKELSELQAMKIVRLENQIASLTMSLNDAHRMSEFQSRVCRNYKQENKLLQNKVHYGLASRSLSAGALFRLPQEGSTQSLLKSPKLVVPKPSTINNAVGSLASEPGSTSPGQCQVTPSNPTLTLDKETGVDVNPCASSEKILTAALKSDYHFVHSPMFSPTFIMPDASFTSIDGKTLPSIAYFFYAKIMTFLCAYRESFFPSQHRKRTRRSGRC
jgi:hypothetical protein